MKIQLLVLLICLGQLLSQAQVIPTPQHAYFQKLTYYGNQQQYYTLTTYLSDSTLYRLDNFQLVDSLDHQNRRQKVAIPQGPTTIMYPNGKIYLNCNYEQGNLNGPLTLFYSDGSIKRREIYRQSQLQQSRCYSPQGEEQFCQAFYQAPQFMGDYNELTHYLEVNLQMFVQPQVQDLVIELSINELGQVTRTTIRSPSDSTDLTLVPAAKVVIERITHWLPDSLSWLSARMDGVSIPDKVVIYMERRKGFLKVYTPRPKWSR